MGKPLNQWIVDRLPSYPEGAGYRFQPTPRDPDDPANPRDPDHDGVTRDLDLGGEVLCRAAPDGATYCCGVTLECWLDAWRDAGGSDAGIDAHRLVDEWFCPVMGHPGVHEALIARDLGLAISDPAEAMPGDLVQYWRRTDLANPSGHSAVFLAWFHDERGTVLRYWSSQPATGGIGIHEEVIGSEWTWFIVRPLAPPAGG